MGSGIADPGSWFSAEGIGSNIGNVWGDISGSNKQAKAAQQMAEAQLAEQRETRRLALGAADEAIKYAMPTAQELQTSEMQLKTLERTMALQEASMKRDQELLNASAPGMVEAGRQAYAMLKGQTSPLEAPVMQQRQLQRKQLEGQLQQQLGSGYANSSAGIEALNAFDRETGMLRNATMGQLMQYSQQGYGIGAQNLLGTSQLASSQQQARMGTLGDLQKRLSTAYTNRVAAITGTNVAPYAGASSVGELRQGQAQQQFVYGTMNTLASMYGGRGGFDASSGGTTAQMPSQQRPVA